MSKTNVTHHSRNSHVGNTFEYIIMID